MNDRQNILLTPPPYAAIPECILSEQKDQFLDITSDINIEF
jgi:hypothetical protein